MKVLIKKGHWPLSGCRGQESQHMNMIINPAFLAVGFDDRFWCEQALRKVAVWGDRTVTHHWAHGLEWSRMVNHKAQALRSSPWHERAQHTGWVQLQDHLYLSDDPELRAKTYPVE
jgi:hypothetical protein